MNPFWKALGYEYAYIHLFFRLKGLNSQVHSWGSSVDLLEKLMSKLDIWFLVGFNHHDKESGAQDGVFQHQWMCPPPFSVSLSRFTLLNLSATPSASTTWHAGALVLPPSLNTLGMMQCPSPSTAIWQSSAHFDNSLRQFPSNHTWD